MKSVFIEKHQAEFSLKAMYREIQVARGGGYAWCLHRYQLNPRQQFRLTCDGAVRQVFTEAKQRYSALPITKELSGYIYLSMPISLNSLWILAAGSILP